MLQKLMTILFLSGDEISIDNLAKLCEVSVVDMESAFSELKMYLNEGGLDLLINKGMVSIATKAEQAKIVQNFWVGELSGELSPATLQVLTLVAYLGSPTQKDISFIRGVQSSQSIRTLSVRGMVTKQGEICTITTDALKYLGVTRIEDLPDFANINKDLKQKLELLYKEQ